MLTDLHHYFEADGKNLREQPLYAFSIPRRLFKRCWGDRHEIDHPRVFCQNSGGCGSTYIVQLLLDNGVDRCFHELAPDLNELGVAHFRRPVSRRRAVNLLRYTRHDVFFEANNRLFSFSRELHAAFPQARFIHLHRHPAAAIRSAMSKPDLDRQLSENVRYTEFLAGPRSERPLVRFCHYWANVNGRIHRDIMQLAIPDHHRYSLRFDHLVSGRIGMLEDAIGQELPVRTRSAVNQGRLTHRGQFPQFSRWSDDDQTALRNICGPVMRQLGYSFSETDPV